MSVQPLLDWTQNPPPIDGSTALAIEAMPDDQVQAYRDAAVAGIAALKGTVDPVGIATAAGVVSFGTLDDAVANDTAGFDAAASKEERFGYADHLVYVWQQAELAYLNSDGSVKAKFSLSQKAAAAVSGFGSGLVVTTQIALFLCIVLVGGAIALRVRG